MNKKQCSRQLQCEVPCAGNVVNSSLSSSSSTSHAVRRGGGSSLWGVQAGGGGQGTFHPPCHILHYHMVLRPQGTSHNQGALLSVLFHKDWENLKRLSDELLFIPVVLCFISFLQFEHLYFQQNIQKSQRSRQTSPQRTQRAEMFQVRVSKNLCSVTMGNSVVRQTIPQHIM